MGSIRNLHVVMLVGVACVLQSAAKVCPYSAEACHCHSLEVHCFSVEEIPTLIRGPHVTRVHSVAFCGGNITTVSKDNLPRRLAELTFIDNPLTQIMDDAFDASANSLNVVRLWTVKLTTLPRALGRLTNLTALYISATPIQEWNETLLQQIGTTVKKLELSYLGISGHPGWISNFHALETLDLSGNNLKTISDDIFSSFKDTLGVLRLKNNGLTAVPQSLSSLKNLTSLDLSGNNLNHSEISKLLALPSVSNLPTLIITSVALTQMPNFSKLHGLKTINLDNNNLSDVTAGSLPPSVTDLSLKGNNLSSVPLDVPLLTKLQHLYLSKNNITTITNVTLANLTLLEFLYLDNNPIINISPTGFSGLESLKYLDIGYTNLSEIPTAFSKLTAPSINIYMLGIPSVSCPCQMSLDLHTWFANSYSRIYFDGHCSNGQPMSNYLFYGCVTQEPQPTTTPTTMPTSATTKGCAPAPEFSVVCKYGPLLFLLSLLFAGFY